MKAGFSNLKKVNKKFVAYYASINYIIFTLDHEGTFDVKTLKDAKIVNKPILAI